MGNTRRDVLKAGVASLGALALWQRRANAVEQQKESEEEKPMEPMRPLDYGLSFICHAASFNAVRFWVESRTRIVDANAGTCTDYYQCASCKSEHTFAEKDLFQEDNYDFLPIFGAGNVLIFRRPVRLSDRYRQVSKCEEVWGAPILRLREASAATELNTWEEIRDATAAALPIVTQTEIQNADTGLRAIIECPTKTMNVSLEKQMYQVDTGPIALPDLTKQHDPQIDCLSLAFIVFNAPDFADFVVEQPTPVMEDEAEKCRVYHYSNPFSLPAKNRLLALSNT